MERFFIFKKKINFQFHSNKEYHIFIYILEAVLEY